jgi:hypothetical protein
LGCCGDETPQDKHGSAISNPIDISEQSVLASPTWLDSRTGEHVSIEMFHFRTLNSKDLRQSSPGDMLGAQRALNARENKPDLWN